MANAELLYYDGNGKRVKSPVSGGRQFLSTDPNRPDAKKAQDEPEAEVQVVEEPEEEKAQEAPPADKARRPAANKARQSAKRK